MRAIVCSTRSTVENPFYPGKAAGDVYDNRFKESHRIPFLPEHVPQGLAAWSNWPHGSGEDDLLLITSYDPAERYSLIIGIDAKTGKRIGAAKIAYSHVGGIAIFEKLGWAFVSDEEPRKVRKYSLKKLADAISTSDKKILDSEPPDQSVIGASFLTSHGPTNTLWAGNFKQSAKGGRPRMKAYKVDKNGQLTPENGSWEVPIKTQGVVVTKDFLIYSTSFGRNNRSNLYVVRRGKGETNLDNARLFCFRSPSMSEGIAVYGDNLYVLYESGARIYNPPIAPGNPKPDVPRNKISNLHRAPLSSLEELPPRSGPSPGTDRARQAQIKTLGGVQHLR
ncbi:MAG: hypothetical protein KJZ78_12695 [Bryobacteraceae bacterium]|nr:hypothetical protein [Bryobacteraceae bacterium]